MPNYCQNNLKIEHEDNNKIKEFVDNFINGSVCEHYLPTPKKENGEVSDEWWSYRVSEWGTKWDIGGKEEKEPVVDEKSATVTFLSAWSPPLGLYQHLVNLGFHVNATYFEPGMAFCGSWEDGHDNCFEGVENFPENLKEEYNMYEFYEELFEEEDDVEDNDGQPDEYTEWQDYMGGDDWNHGQFD